MKVLVTIAPRYFKAKKEKGNKLLTAFDPFDSICIIDDFFPRADFFTELKRFD